MGYNLKSLELNGSVDLLFAPHSAGDLLSSSFKAPWKKIAPILSLHSVQNLVNTATWCCSNLISKTICCRVAANMTKTLLPTHFLPFLRLFACLVAALEQSCCALLADNSSSSSQKQSLLLCFPSCHHCTVSTATA